MARHATVTTDTENNILQLGNLQTACAGMLYKSSDTNQIWVGGTDGSLIGPMVVGGDLATVATSGSYDDLINIPDLSAFDNVDTYGNQASFPATGLPDIFYIAQDTGQVYRWDGVAYAVISGGIALGNTASTAHRGDHGSAAYTHSLILNGNPHNIDKADVGLPNVDNTSDANKPVSGPQQIALNGKAGLSGNNFYVGENEFDGPVAFGNIVDFSGTTSGLRSDDVSDSAQVQKFTTAAEKSKLAGIEAGATADQVADEVPMTGYVKPASGGAIAATDSVDAAIGKLERDLENATAGGGDPNVQSDWLATSGDAFILNKPTAFPPTPHTHLAADITDFATAVGTDATVAANTAKTGVSPASLEAAGAVMDTNTTTNGFQFVIDEDDMVSNSPVKLPTQQSVKAYVDSRPVASSAQGTLADTAVQPGDLATVATSGSYTDLINLPDLSAFDNVDTYANQASFPATGLPDIFYIAQDTGEVFRWDGAAYAVISGGLALGNTASTAHRGDHGQAAYAHSLVNNGNPHNIDKADVGLPNVDNTSDLNKPVSSATQTALNGKANTAHTHVAADITDFAAAVGTDATVAANTAKEGVTPASINNAGAVMTTDVNTNGFQFVIDEDDMLSNSPVQLPTQQSVKAFAESMRDAAQARSTHTGTQLLATISDFDSELFLRHEPPVRSGSDIVLDNNVAGVYYNEATPSSASIVTINPSGARPNGAALFFSDGTEITTIESTKTVLQVGQQAVGQVGVLSLLNTPNYVLANWIPTEEPITQLATPVIEITPADGSLSYAISGQDPQATLGVMETSTDGNNWTPVSALDYDGQTSTQSGIINGLSNGVEYQVRFKNTAAGFADSNYSIDAGTPAVPMPQILLNEPFTGPSFNLSNGTVVNPTGTVNISQNERLVITKSAGSANPAAYGDRWESVLNFNPASQPELVCSFKMSCVPQSSAVGAIFFGLIVPGNDTNRFGIINGLGSNAEIRTLLRDSSNPGTLTTNALDITVERRYKIAMTPTTGRISYWDGTSWVELKFRDLGAQAWFSQNYKVYFSIHGSSSTSPGLVEVDDLFVTDYDYTTETP